MPVKYKGDIAMFFVNGLNPVYSESDRITPNDKFFVQVQLLRLLDLEEFIIEKLEKELVLFPIADIEHSTKWGITSNSWVAAETPGLDIPFYTAEGGTVGLIVKTADNTEVSQSDFEAESGLRRSQRWGSAAPSCRCAPGEAAC